MTKPLKNILFAIAGLLGLLILIPVVLLWFVDTNVYKPRMERAASKALGSPTPTGDGLRAPGRASRFRTNSAGWVFMGRSRKNGVARKERWTARLPRRKAARNASGVWRT